YIVKGALEAGMADDRLHYYDSAASAASEVRSLLKPDDLVYIKASRGIGIEAILKLYDRSGGKR
ncbi:MAG TPA: hypothetical protein VJ983_07235, partial [candidate division Zixibacteria bacterium]|nr:hypothetical protein [candidate division Zixibacteria bacterium]